MKALQRLFGWRLVALYVGLGLTPLLVLGYVSLTLATRALLAQVNNQLTNSAAVSSLFVGDRMRGFSDLVTSYATRPSMLTAVGDGDPAHYDKAAIELNLSELTQADPEITYGFVADPSGRLYDIDPRDPTVVNQDFSYRDWYKGAVATGRTYVSEAYKSAVGSHPLVVAVAAPVWHAIPGRTPKLAGILAAAVGLSSIHTLTNEFSSAEGLSLTITDQRGVVVGKTGVGPTALTSMAADPRVTAALTGRSGSSNSSPRQPVLFAYAPVAGIGWTALVERQASIALVQIHSLIQTLLVLTGILVTVVLGGGAVLYLMVRAQEKGESEIRRLNTELAHRVAVTQSVLNNIGDGVAVADATGQLTFNPAAERILGMGVVEGNPSEWSERYGVFQTDKTTPYPPDALPLARAMRGEAVDQVELFIRNTGSPQGGWVSVTARPLKDAAGSVSGGVAVFRDVTAQRTAEQQVRSLNAELEERAAQLEAANKELEAFSYTVSHDLRAPLRAINGFVRILLEEHAASLADEARRYLAVVASNAQQMGRLVDDLLRFSRLSRQPLQKRPVELNSIVGRVLEQLQGSMEARQIEISVAQLPECQGDAALLEQVYVNLIGNAIKYTKGNEAARIEVGCRTGDDGQPVYYVRDNGAGFDMRYVNKLFGVFQRLHRAEEYEGTGVGLAIVQRIVHRHGGQIWPEAEVGKGATFFFTLGGDRERQPKAA